MAAPPAKKQMVGFDKFVRSNPKTDLFDVIKFDHVEFWTSDATSTARRFSTALGMQMVGSSDLMTGNQDFITYAMRSRDITFVVTAPYFTDSPPPEDHKAYKPWPGYDKDKAFEMIKVHGQFIRAVGVLVGDVAKAFEASVGGGAVPVTKPYTAADETGEVQLAEVKLYDDVVLRFVQRKGEMDNFLPGYAPQPDRKKFDYGLVRMDHIVGNVPEMAAVTGYIAKITGFHQFAEFTAEDVGTVDSGLNSTVMASNNEMVLLPVNEPTHGTRRKSQIQTYLEHNRGAGVQHIALKSDDIFKTLKAMKDQSQAGGLEFMPRPSDNYYRTLREKVGDTITDEQYRLAEEFGVLVDRDDQGTLLQIFTRPVQDRPTFFIEIIQRVGCALPGGDQLPGCGGFGKGNFKELFKSIEDFEKIMDGEAAAEAAKQKQKK